MTRETSFADRLYNVGPLLTGSGSVGHTSPNRLPPVSVGAVQYTTTLIAPTFTSCALCNVCFNPTHLPIGTNLHNLNIAAHTNKPAEA